MFDDIPSSPLEGDMNIPGRSKNTTDISQPDFNTLDEPIKETFVSCLIKIQRRNDENKQICPNFSSVTFEQFAQNSTTSSTQKRSHHCLKIVSYYLVCQGIVF